MVNFILIAFGSSIIIANEDFVVIRFSFSYIAVTVIVMGIIVSGYWILLSVI